MRRRALRPTWRIFFRRKVMCLRPSAALRTQRVWHVVGCVWARLPPVSCAAIFLLWFFNDPRIHCSYKITSSSIRPLQFTSIRAAAVWAEHLECTVLSELSIFFCLQILREKSTHPFQHQDQCGHHIWYTSKVSWPHWAEYLDSTTLPNFQIAFCLRRAGYNFDSMPKHWQQRLAKQDVVCVRQRDGGQTDMTRCLQTQTMCPWAKAGLWRPQRILPVVCCLLTTYLSVLFRHRSFFWLFHGSHFHRRRTRPQN